MLNYLINAWPFTNDVHYFVFWIRNFVDRIRIQVLNLPDPDQAQYFFVLKQISFIKFYFK